MDDYKHRNIYQSLYEDNVLLFMANALNIDLMLRTRENDEHRATFVESRNAKATRTPYWCLKLGNVTMAVNHYLLLMQT